MKIRLTATGIPYTTGIIIQSQDTTSGSDFQSIADAQEIAQIYFQDSTGVLGGERLGTYHNVWLPYRMLNNIVPSRGDILLVDITNPRTDLEYDIDIIEWQEENTIRYTIKAGGNINNVERNDYIKIEDSTNSENNGTFEVTNVDKSNLYIDITNANRPDNTKDEASDSPAKLNTIYTQYDIVDMKREILSQFENHYEINIGQRND